MEKLLMFENLKGIERTKKGSLTDKILLASAGIIFMLAAIQFVNTSKYSMVVNVKDGENIMGINPLGDRLDFGDLTRNNGMTRYVNLQSGGNIPTYVFAWKFGEISDLVKIDANSFVLAPGEEKKMAFEVQIPASAQTRQYSGWVWIFRLPKLI